MNFHLALLSVLFLHFQPPMILFKLVCRRNISGQEFSGMYCVVLVVKYVDLPTLFYFFYFAFLSIKQCFSCKTISYACSSIVVSAALLRIFGKDVAELPLVATERQNQGKVRPTWKHTSILVFLTYYGVV